MGGVIDLYRNTSFDFVNIENASIGRFLGKSQIFQNSMFFFQNNHQNIGLTPQQCGKAATELYLKHKLVRFVPRRTRWVTI